MSGTPEGSKRAAATNKMRYGNEFYRLIGKAGGIKSRGGGFASLTREQLQEMGRKGGTKSKRGKSA